MALTEMKEIKSLTDRRARFDGRLSLELWQKALARWRKEERWAKHHSRVATSPWEKSRAA